MTRAAAKKRYRHQDLMRTANNLLAIFIQDTHVHPLERVRVLSAQGTPALQTVIAQLATAEDTRKNGVLNLISRYEATTKGGEDMKPMLRTLILSNSLDERDKTMPIREAQALILSTKDDTDPNDKFGQRRTAWTERAITQLIEAGVSHVHLDHLLNLSAEAVLMGWHIGGIQS